MKYFQIFLQNDINQNKCCSPTLSFHKCIDQKDYIQNET